MVTKKIGVIGCGNMGGAILYGALESGVLAKENVYVYDINPAMMEKAKGWGVNLATDDEDVCKNSDIILLAVKPQNAAEALEQCKKALDGKAMMSIVAGVTVERLQAMIDGTPRILRLLPNTPAMVFAGAFALCSDNDFKEDEMEIAKSIYSSIGVVELASGASHRCSLRIKRWRSGLCCNVHRSNGRRWRKTGTSSRHCIPPCRADLPWNCKDAS